MSLIIRTTSSAITQHFESTGMLAHTKPLTFARNQFCEIYITYATSASSLISSLPINKRLIVKKLKHYYDPCSTSLGVPNFSTRGEQEVNAFKQISKLPDATSFVAQFYGAVKSRLTTYILMECCPGKDIFQFLEPGLHDPTLRDPRREQLIAMQCIKAVDWLHGHGWHHGDLKTENFIVHHNITTSKSSSTVTVRLIDFALSTRNPFRLIGNSTMPVWAPPESISTSSAPKTHYSMQLSDLWMFAITLLFIYELVQEESFKYDEMVERKGFRRTQGDTYHLLMRRGLLHLPATVFSKALATSPESRYHSLGDMMIALCKAYPLS